jgi:hypothetical protein
MIYAHSRNRRVHLRGRGRCGLLLLADLPSNESFCLLDEARLAGVGCVSAILLLVDVASAAALCIVSSYTCEL